MPSSARRRLSLILFFTALLFCAWFFQVGNVNQIARYDAIFAFFENTGDDAHTFRIDRYLYSEGKVLNTSDWSEYGGHYYSNKSPGTTWFGVALLAPIYPLQRHFRPEGDGISPHAEIFDAWYLNFMMGVLPTAFSVLALAGILLKLGASGARAYPGALLIVLGTAVFPFSTTLMAHSTVAACLVFSLWAYLRGGKSSLFASGAWFGAAVLFDYSAGLLLPLALAGIACREKGRIWQFIAGGIPFAVLYCVYNAMCFGGPFSFAAQYINPIYRTEGNAAGGLLALPNAWLILELLFGARRGVLISSPFFFFAIPGFLFLWKQEGLRRGVALLMVLSFAVLLLMNASFNGWHSGASFTARYIVPVYPLVGILAVMAPLKPGWRRVLFGLLAAVSLLNMFAVASYSVTPPENDPSPIYITSYRHLPDTAPPIVLMSQLGLQSLRPDAAELRDAARFTIGSLAGLSYGASRLFLFLAGVALWTLLLMILSNSDPERSSAGDRASTTVMLGFAPIERVDISSFLLKRQVGLWGVLACGTAAAALLLPGDIPFTYGAELQVQEAALDAVEGHTFANPFGKWGLATLFYQMLYLFTKDIILLAFLKTALSLTACFLQLNEVAKRSKLSAPLLFLFAASSPYLLLAHKSLRGDSLLLPAGALVLFALIRLAEKDGGARRKRIEFLLLSLLIWALLWLRTPAGQIPLRGPFAVLQTTFGGFADVFHPGLGDIDREAGTFLGLMTVASVLFMGALLLTGTVLVFARRDRVGIVAFVLVLLASLSFFVMKPYHPFHCLYAAPFAAYLETTGASWFLTGRPARTAKVVLGVYFSLCLCGWLVFLGAIHRDAGNRADTFGVTLSERQEGAMKINSELRLYSSGPIEISARNDAEQRMFFPVGWLAVLDSIRDPYIQWPSADPPPGFFIAYRDGTRTPTGYLRIMSRFKDDGKILERLPKVPADATPAD